METMPWMQWASSPPVAGPPRLPTRGTDPPFGGPPLASCLKGVQQLCHSQIHRRVQGASRTPCRRLCCPRMPALRASPTSPARCLAATQKPGATRCAPPPAEGFFPVSPGIPWPVTVSPTPFSGPDAMSCAARSPCPPCQVETAHREGCAAGRAREGRCRAVMPRGQHRPSMARRWNRLGCWRPGWKYKPGLAAVQATWRNNCPQRRKNPPSARANLTGPRWP